MTIYMRKAGQMDTNNSPTKERIRKMLELRIRNPMTPWKNTPSEYEATVESVAATQC